MVSPTDWHWRDALYFWNLTGDEQLVRCPTRIAGNRLDLVMINAPDIVNVFVGLITALSVLCFRLGNLYWSTMSEVLSF